MKIYTKTGDKGETSLLNGTRVSKTHLRIEAYGTLDELNANIGLLRDQPINQNRGNFFNHVQNLLFVIGAHLADEKGTLQASMPSVEEKDIELLETYVDSWEETLSPLKNFILPGGHLSVSVCHVARTVCRRAERVCVSLAEQTEIDSRFVIFLNRLSDALFVLSRKMAQELHVQEIVWDSNNV